jgi:hypothetical protein
VSALASPEVGRYVNEYFSASFQKVATFRIVGGAKQGGNVASYFCAPDGRVLHVVAGPVDAAAFLAEAKWVVETTKKAMAEAKRDGAKFKAHFRTAHARRLREEHGLVVEPVTYDPPIEQDGKSLLTYSDPSGRPLAPKLPPPPIDGPDVAFKDKQEGLRAAGAPAMLDRKGGRWALGNQGRVHHIMAAHSMAKIEQVYGTIFENVLGEKISTKPVEVVTPFPWVRGEAAAK